MHLDWIGWLPTQLRAGRHHVLLLLVSLVVVACGPMRKADIPMISIALPPGATAFNAVLWLPTGHIVLEGRSENWYRAPASAEWQRLPRATGGLCPRPSHNIQLTALPDGRLGLLCGRDTGLRLDYSLLAYDWSTATFAQLVPGDLPGPGAFSWKPDMSKGVFADVGSFSTLYWLVPHGVSPVPITLTDGGKTWALPDSLDAQEAYDQQRNPTGLEPHPVGLVRDPRWAPDGKHIAFWATLETIGQPYNFPIVPWDIYLMDPDTLEVERVVADIADPGALAWSPNSAWLGFVAKNGNNHPAGLWIVSVGTRTPILIDQGDFSDVSWSPTGTSILAVHCTSDTCATTELRQYDVTTLVAPGNDKK